MHSLLKRQLKRHFGDQAEIPPQWRAFIESVDDAYRGFDDDRRMLEHSLDLSSQELLAANAEMRAVFQAIPDVVLRVNHEGTILDIKAGAEADLMLERQQLVGKRIQATPLKAVGRQFAAAIEQVIAQNAPVSIEYSAVLRGQESHYEARLAPLQERQIAVIIRNVTERKQSLRLLGSAVEQSTEAIAITDANLQWPGSRVLFVNPAFTRMTGYSAAEMLGQTPYILQGPKSDRAAVRRMRETLRAGQPCAGESIAYRKDGTEFHIEWQVVPLRDSGGTVTHFLGVQRDISARKQAQEELRLKTAFLEAQVNSSIDGIIVVNQEGRTILQNQRTVEIFKMPPELAECSDDARRVKWVMGTTRDPEQFAQKVAHLYSHPDEISRDEIELKDGTTLDRYSSPVVGQDGKHYGRIWTFRDITERIRTETALRESNEKFRQLAENISDVFWIRSPDMREVHYVSPAFKRIWGRQPQSLVENPAQWTDAIVPQDRDRVVATFNTLMAQAPSISIEYRITRPDGGIRWIHARGFQVRDAADRLIRLTGIITDITERKQAEQALRDSEERFHFLHDLTEATRALADPDCIMEVMARMLGRQLGASRCAYSELDGDGDRFAVRQEYVADDASAAAESRKSGSRRLSDFGPRATSALFGGRTLIIRDVDKELLPHEGAGMFNSIEVKALVACPLVKDGTLRALMVLHQDRPRDWTPQEIAIVQEVVERCWATVERRSAEEALRVSESRSRSIIESAQDSFASIDADGRIREWNRQAESVFGWSRAEAMGRLLHETIIPPRHREAHARVLRELQAAGATSGLNKLVEFTALRSDGTEFPAEMIGWSLTAGSETTYQAFVRDITERKRAQAELENVHRQLVDSSRRAGMAEIATNVLHNVGNVLNSVNVSAAIVANTLRNSRARGLTQAVRLLENHSADLGAYLSGDAKGKLLPGYLSGVVGALAQEQQGMVEELAHLTQSIDHIKGVVATQQSYAGGGTLIEAVQVCDLAEDALRMNANLLVRGGVIVVKQFASVPVMRLDRARVLQILVNLISNAAHAMDAAAKAGPRLTLRVDRNGGALRISVEDEGEGIPAQNLTLVFSHGFTTRKSGHGFGLHSCALAARQMGGTLTAHSDGPGAGAVFTLELPIAGVSQSPQPGAAGADGAGTVHLEDKTLQDSRGPL